MQLVHLIVVQLIFIFIFITTEATSSGTTFIFFLIFVLTFIFYVKFEDGLHVVTVATEQTDGYKRFLRSLNVYGYSYEVII